MEQPSDPITAHIFLIGLNHQTAPVQIREQFALAGDGLRLALRALVAEDALSMCGGGGIILSTCNRLEVYLVATSREAAFRQFENFAGQLYGTAVDGLWDCLYEMVDEEAARHLLRVACGLESLVLGEPQILGQVAQALTKARAAEAAGALLARLFEQAVRAGKRAHSETGISQHTTSTSHAAAHLARQHLGELADKTVLVIGAGEMAKQAAQAFCMQGIGEMVCISRTMSHAEELASQAGGRASSWLRMPEELSRADVIITATSAPHIILPATTIRQSLSLREERPLMIVDIAVPRNVDESAGLLSGVTLYDIDDLHAAVDEAMAQRRAAVPQVESIIEEELGVFQSWWRGREILPTLIEMRRKAHEIADRETARTLHELNGAAPEVEEAVQYLAYRIVQKLMHEPTLCLKAHAGCADITTFTQTVQELFALEEPGTIGREN